MKDGDPYSPPFPPSSSIDGDLLSLETADNKSKGEKKRKQQKNKEKNVPHFEIPSFDGNLDFIPAAKRYKYINIFVFSTILPTSPLIKKRLLEFINLNSFMRNEWFKNGEICM